MNVPTRLALFGATVSLAFVAAYGVGAASAQEDDGGNSRPTTTISDPHGDMSHETEAGG
jgi:hypothetical protein